MSQTHYPSKILPILYPNRRPAIPPTPESKTELIEKNPLPHSKGIAPPAVEPTKIPSHIQSFFIHFQYSHLMEPHQGIPRRPRCSFSILPYTPRYLDENAILEHPAAKETSARRQVEKEKRGGPLLYSRDNRFPRHPHIPLPPLSSAPFF